MVALKSIRGRKLCTFRGARDIPVRASPSMQGGGEPQCAAARGEECGAGGGEYVFAIFPYIYLNLYI